MKLKKLTKLAIIYILLLFIGATLSLSMKPVMADTEEPAVIPDEAIRLRILANSNSSEDQALKVKVRDEVNKEITKWVEELTSIQDARDLIQNRLGDIEVIVERVLEEENSDQAFTVGYGKQVKFPTKVYGSYLYPAGEYEAILITLGEAQGNNWWCVLFPPLCFLDFGNGEAVDASKDEAKQAVTAEVVEEESEVEVKFFVVEWLSKIFG
ncbi:stage II sporulation protein R [Bacillus mesophilus]|uniref:Stage II sporulation protein R n=1 Tax=Bacillus mesophilus TaxID=1808955 RepID=A0A6M0Q9J5_9BACI|nr:stage II sporulation protein R [Bacillus mesophilus]MBM7662446.1 stage II sporulation protein R [Bacillus mesophilus]NEY72927.1 stage II sporulation protein R [Bacillus mesophilus]